MFNRENYRKGLEMFMTDANMIEKALDRMEHRQRNLKKGDKVIQLSYSGSIIPEQDILKFEKELDKVGYQLSYIDGDEEIRADFFDITNQISIEFVAGFIAGNLQNAAYDIIKTFFIWMWEQGKTKLTSRLQSGTITKHQTTTAMILYHGKHKSIIYIFPNDLPSKTVNKAIDSLMLETSKHSEKYEGRDAYYEHYKLQRNGLWKHSKLQPSKKQRKKSKKLIDQILKNNKTD